jgi:hypothetical protein
MRNQVAAWLRIADSRSAAADKKEDAGEDDKKNAG